MSYCVNCGVELAPSEKRCPLCHVPVINPADPWKEPEEHPYPRRIETVEPHIDRRFFSLFATLILMVPILICLINDLFVHGKVTWSVFVIGGAGVVFVFFLLPFLIGKCSPVLLWTFDTVAVLGFLLLTERKVGGNDWFLPLALPLTLVLAAICLLFLQWFQTRRSILMSMAFLCYAAGIYAMCVEMIVNLYRRLSPMPHWSWYSLVPCVLIGTAFLILNRRKKWRDSIYKRMFF